MVCISQDGLETQMTINSTLKKKFHLFLTHAICSQWAERASAYLTTQGD